MKNLGIRIHIFVVRESPGVLAFRMWKYVNTYRYINLQLDKSSCFKFELNNSFFELLTAHQNLEKL